MSTSQSPTVDATAIERFRASVYAHYAEQGRDFPWRHTSDPYHILVAEVMLQQTQTGRVVQKYLQFLDRFPDVAALARSGAAEVLDAWQGLGYNRRALALHRAAQTIVEEHAGRVPWEREALQALPGIGRYSAAATRAFAFDLPEVFIETNIRTAFIHEFFPEAMEVRDRDILPLVEASIDRANPRRWYQALMDYGAMLKQGGNPSRRSAHHRPQSRFHGSRREARGIILRTLLHEGPTTQDELKQRIAGWDSRFDDALGSLARDGLVAMRGEAISAAT